MATRQIGEHEPNHDEHDVSRSIRAAAPRLGWRWLAIGLACIVLAGLAGVCLGPVQISPLRVLRELADSIPGVDVSSGLSQSHAAIVTKIRAPRVVLGLLVGAMLAGAGASYQGVFRNPLADPYLLGIASGAGLGATVALVANLGDGRGFLDPVPVAAFVGALGAVALTMTVAFGERRTHSSAHLLLAGVGVASFLTACQTYWQTRHQDSLQEVFSWILGRLSSATWADVAMLAPYAVVSAVALVLASGYLDVLAVGEEEASTLGVRPGRVRLVVLLAASLGAAAAVSVSGLIGFVGLVVPHTVRMLAGTTYRRVVPLSMLFGGGFLALTDVLARTVEAPAELPIGVITAFLGAPFFMMLLRRSDVV